MTTTTSTSPRSSSERASRRSSPGARDLLTPPRPAATLGAVRIVCSRRSDGDFHRELVPAADLEPRRRGLVDLPWTMLDEHHGTTVVRVTVPGEHDGAPGDVAFTDRADAVLGCWAGDCAPVVLVGTGHELAVVHAGWRGLAAGVIDAAVAAFSEPVAGAVLGPAIGACCYEFGAAELAAVAAGVHAEVGSVAGVTSAGRPALDVAAAVAAACHHHDVPLTELAGCTGCAFDGFSHRVRGERGRHVVAAWRPGATAPAEPLAVAPDSGGVPA